MLVDTGSTHNFVDLEVAKRVGCPTQLIKSHKVLVANEDKLQCNSKYVGFEWKMQETKFVADVLIMPIIGCELIIGIEWLNMIGVVKCDFSNLRMEFCWHGTGLLLQADDVTSGRLKEGKAGSQKEGVRLLLIHDERLEEKLAEKT